MVSLHFNRTLTKAEAQEGKTQGSCAEKAEPGWNKFHTGTFPREFEPCCIANVKEEQRIFP